MCGGTGSDTQHWSGKLEGCACITSMLMLQDLGHASRKILKLHALRLNEYEGIFKNIYLGVILAFAVHIVYLFI